MRIHLVSFGILLSGYVFGLVVWISTAVAPGRSLLITIGDEFIPELLMNVIALTIILMEICAQLRQREFRWKLTWRKKK